MVRPQLKLSRLEKKTKMPDGEESGQEFPVESGISHFGFSHFLAEKCERGPPSILPLLKNGAEMRGGSVRGQG